MDEYKVRITEILVREVTVAAENEDSAYSAIKQQYRDEKIILDASDFCDVEFATI